MKQVFFFILFIMTINCADNNRKKKSEQTTQIENITINQLNGTWELQPVNGIQVTDQKLYIQFDTTFNQINGYSGCNNFSSTIKMTENKLIIGSLVTTKIACDNTELENKFIDAIIDTSMISLNNDILILTKTGSKLEFKRQIN